MYGTLVLGLHDMEPLLNEFRVIWEGYCTYDNLLISIYTTLESAEDTFMMI